MKLGFSKFHPLVNLIYFTAVICISIFVMHPVFIAISSVTALCLSIILKGATSLRLTVKIILPMAVISVLINILTNRNGTTPIATLPFNIVISCESLIAGICTAGVIASAILWFVCFNTVFTNEKLIYLLGRKMPSLSLILSMVLRFIPSYKKQFKQTITSQRTIGYDIAVGKPKEKLKTFAKIMSVMTGKVLENSIDTADSMRGRGYGLSGKTNYNIYKFKKTDFLLIFIIIAITIIILYADVEYSYYPIFSMKTSPAVGFICFFILCTIPIIIEIREMVKWKYLKSKI